MKHKKSTAKKPTLDELVFVALSQLQVLGYNARSIRRYQAAWTRLIQFAKQQNFKGQLREQLLLDFLAHHNIKSDNPVSTYKGWKLHAEYSLKILWYYARFGYFERCKILLQSLTIEPKMEKVLYEYRQYSEEKRYLSPFTVNESTRQIGLLLDFLSKRNVTSFKKIQAVHLSDFVSSLWRYQPKTVSGIVFYLRLFLQYFFLKGKIKTDLSETLPSIRITEKAKIPSVWDKALVVKLLKAVDRASPRGKRDYAILILACRLGLRLSDIRALTLDHIDWEHETISIVQAKTQQPLSLPLTDEIGNALIDYIQSARPKTECREVFLRQRPPFVPFSENTHLYHIVNHWKNLAGIKFRTKQHAGMHSLRHSLATHLLETNNSFATIANILGHASMNTTMIYAKSSINTLRKAALPLEEVNHVNQGKSHSISQSP